MPEDNDADTLRAEIERGRLLFARPWRHRMGVATVAGLPAAEGIEVAFAGRSNVGKSSLINALVGQRALARTSNTPGRTRELNFFAIEGAPPGLTLVDMPGYGFARAAKADVAAWTGLIFDYLRGRANLRRVYLLIDARHGLKANDIETLTLLDKTAVSYQAVLTKADKLKPAELEATMAEVAAAIRKRSAAHPLVLATSSATGLGVDTLRAEIAALVPE